MTNSVVKSDGFELHNIWSKSSVVADLYRKRARDEVEEMTCAAQAAELLQLNVMPGDCVLDAGCGSGYFYHSLRKRGLDVNYYGFDATRCLIETGQSELPAFGLSSDRLSVLRLDDFQGSSDHVICMNVLSNIENYHRPLERLLKAAHKSLSLRESIHDQESYSYVRDEFLDPGIDLKVHVNTYDRTEITSFIKSYGFAVQEVVDIRSGGDPEMVIGHPHYWTFLVATRT